jgi:hypothetical protein
LWEQLAAEKSVEERSNTAQPTAQEDKTQVVLKPEEVSTAADEQQVSDDEIAAGDGGAKHAGSGVLLGKQGPEENETADKLSKLPIKRERVSWNGEDSPKEEEPIVKEEGDSVMQLWIDLADHSNSEHDPRDDPAAECKEAEKKVCRSFSSMLHAPVV